MDDIKSLAKTLHPLERKVIPFLLFCKNVDDLSEKSMMKDVEVMRALQWLENKKVLTLSESSVSMASLEENGVKYAKEGLPEIRFLKAIKGEMLVDEAAKKAGISQEEIGICIGTLKGKAAILVSGKPLKVKTLPAAERLLKSESLEQKFIKSLVLPRRIEDLAPEEKFAMDTLLKRKKIVKAEVLKTKSYELTELGKRLVKEKINFDVLERLTPEMLKSGAWKGKEFRAYDVKVNVPKISAGRRHFVRETVSYVKRIWLDMGFEEMEGNIVQSAFWDLDALFVPQDHPAREMQDTFYVADGKNVAKAKLPADIMKKVKDVHENGADTGSKGWQYKWSEDVAKEILLRTHTTVLSAQTIAKLKESDLPKKYFKVGRVYRNEALDWKHLFEFDQVEGIVVGEEANFSYLIGYLREFFGKMGFSDVRIKPSHFPYTEPSAEIEVFNPVRNEWVELGGCGIFRPEVTKTLIGKEVPVLAWGFGPGRILMPYYNLSDIRDLYKNDLELLRNIKCWMR
jgi:phenylalanyl-tRNA synthetase alpha chain